MHKFTVKFTTRVLGGAHRSGLLATRRPSGARSTAASATCASSRRSTASCTPYALARLLKSAPSCRLVLFPLHVAAFDDVLSKAGTALGVDS